MSATDSEQVAQKTKDLLVAQFRFLKTRQHNETTHFVGQLILSMVSKITMEAWAHGASEEEFDAMVDAFVKELGKFADAE